MSQRRLGREKQVRVLQNAVERTTKERQVLAVDLALQQLALRRAAQAICEALVKLASSGHPGAADASRVLLDGLPTFEHVHGGSVYREHCLACVVDEARTMQQLHTARVHAPAVLQ